MDGDIHDRAQVARFDEEDRWRNLPPADTKRWVASRKAKVVRAVETGLITREEAQTRYALSDEELDSWAEAVRRHGVGALRTTRLQLYR